MDAMLTLLFDGMETDKIVAAATYNKWVVDRLFYMSSWRHAIQKFCRAYNVTTNQFLEIIYFAVPTNTSPFSANILIEWAENGPPQRTNYSTYYHLLAAEAKRRYGGITNGPWPRGQSCMRKSISQFALSDALMKLRRGFDYMNSPEVVNGFNHRSNQEQRATYDKVLRSLEGVPYVSKFTAQFLAQMFAILGKASMEILKFSELYKNNAVYGWFPSKLREADRKALIPCAANFLGCPNYEPYVENPLCEGNRITEKKDTALPAQSYVEFEPGSDGAPNRLKEHCFSSRNGIISREVRPVQLHNGPESNVFWDPYARKELENMAPLDFSGESIAEKKLRTKRY